MKNFTINFTVNPAKNKMQIVLPEDQSLFDGYKSIEEVVNQVVFESGMDLVDESNLLIRFTCVGKSNLGAKIDTNISELQGAEERLMSAAIPVAIKALGLGSFDDVFDSDAPAQVKYLVSFTSFLRHMGSDFGIPNDVFSALGQSGSWVESFKNIIVRFEQSFKFVDDPDIKQAINKDLNIAMKVYGGLPYAPFIEARTRECLVALKEHVSLKSDDMVVEMVGGVLASLLISYTIKANVPRDKFLSLIHI